MRLKSYFGRRHVGENRPICLSTANVFHIKGIRSEMPLLHFLFYFAPQKPFLYPFLPFFVPMQKKSQKAQHSAILDWVTTCFFVLFCLFVCFFLFVCLFVWEIKGEVRSLERHFAQVWLTNEDHDRVAAIYMLFVFCSLFIWRKKADTWYSFTLEMSV